MTKAISILLLLCGLGGAAQAQMTEAEIGKRLIGKPLFLRGFWANDSLKFDAAGKLVNNSKTKAFSLCGIDVEHVSLQHDKLVLDGWRTGLQFIKNRPSRIILSTQRQTIGAQELMKIEIAAPVSGDYGPALSAIFADGLADITPQLPQFWQRYARRYFAKGELAPEDPKTVTAELTRNDSPNLRKASKTFPPPKLLHDEEPTLPEDVAKTFKTIESDVLLRFVVTENGDPSDIFIIMPAGLGMDEAAAATVQKYKFSPVIENGKPVPVAMQVEVRFAVD